MATATEHAPAEIAVEPDTLYEVVGGVVVEKPSMGAYEAEIAWMLATLLNEFAKANGLGRAINEMLFRIDPAGKTNRRPDVAFISRDRWPVDRRAPRTAAWDVVPDLAVEVLSPGNKSVDDRAKLAEYFRAGVRLVWVIYPTLDTVDVYTSPTEVRILTRGDTLDGGDVLPGFAVGLAELFGEPAT